MENKELEQKAKELVSDFYAIQSTELGFGLTFDMAKECAMVALNNTLILIKQREVSLGFMLEIETDINEILNEIYKL